MKLITLFKWFGVIGVATVGISSAVVFSNVNNIKLPYARILTKTDYLTIKNSQVNNGVSQAELSINYAGLPSSRNSLVDLMTTKNLGTNAFILTLGSQAYADTNFLLNGINQDWNNGGNPELGNNTSLMLRLYNLFYDSPNDSSVADYDMNFYSYIDIVNTKEYSIASQLLQNRKTTLGDLPPDVTDNSIIASNRWKVLNDDGQWDPTRNNIQPVVRGGDNFNFAPDVSTYYEFRADNKADTKYEKIYFRNDDQTRTYLETTAWLKNYATTNHSVSIAEEGSLLCAKFEENAWVFKAFSGFGTNSVNQVYNDIVTFYSSTNTENNTN